LHFDSCFYALQFNDESEKDIDWGLWREERTWRLSKCLWLQVHLGVYK